MILVQLAQKAEICNIINPLDYEGCYGGDSVRPTE